MSQFFWVGMGTTLFALILYYNDIYCNTYIYINDRIGFCLSFGKKIRVRRRMVFENEPFSSTWSLMVTLLHRPLTLL